MFENPRKHLTGEGNRVIPLEGSGEAVVLRGSEKVYRWFEFTCLFFIVPILLTIRTVNVPFLPLLYAGFAGCLVMLLRDKTFDRRQLWKGGEVWPDVPRILGVYVLGIAVVVGGVLLFIPERFLSFPRERPLLWGAVMLLYPVLSVYPQNVIYRCFVFHRYGGLIGEPKAMVGLSALAFCFGHVLFQNSLALLLTLAGGVLFATTYQRTRSAMACSLEHAMYGCMVFTVGLGQYLYYAAVNR